MSLPRSCLKIALVFQLGFSSLVYSIMVTADAVAISGFVLNGNTLLETSALQQSLLKFHGEPAQAATLKSVRQLLVDAYKEAGYELVTISDPIPVTDDGVFLVGIEEITLSAIKLEGNTFFAEAQILAALPELRAGVTPNLNLLSRQLLLAGDNPARAVSVEFGQTDKVPLATVVVDDRRLWDAQLLLDNTGEKSTGKTRLSVIASHSNLWGKGHVLAASVTGSPEKSDGARQAGLYYQMPVPRWGDLIRVSASWSDVDVGRVADAFDISGSGNTLGVHFVHYLKRSVIWGHAIDVGIDHRLFRNTIDFFGTDIGVDVASRPLSATYSYYRVADSGNWSAGLTALINLAHGPNNDDAAYGSNRAGAESKWHAWRATLNYSKTLANNWTINLITDGQYATEPLITGEQFGIGGAYSVRGLHEREAVGDSGVLFSAQLTVPGVFPACEFLAFGDIGKVWRRNSLSGEDRSELAASVGLGLRRSFLDHIAVAIDVAHVLEDSLETERHDNRAHFSVSVSF